MLVKLKASPFAGLQARSPLTVRATMTTAVPCVDQMQAPSWSVKAVLASIIYTVLACKKSLKMIGIVRSVMTPDLQLLLMVKASMLGSISYLYWVRCPRRPSSNMKHNSRPSPILRST